MNHDDELERLLRKWGRVFGPPPPSEWDEESSDGAGALTSIAMQIVRVGVAAIKPEPFGEGMGYTAKGKPSEGGASRWQPDLEADAVEQAWLQVYRSDRLQGVVMKFYFCARGPLKSKLPVIREAAEIRRLGLSKAYEILDDARYSMDALLFTARDKTLRAAFPVE